MVSYQCAIDAVTSRCFPSYALRRRAVAAGAIAQFEFLLIAAAVAEGWAVSVPDHEGLNGIWGAPYEPGYRVLDGLRAALNTKRLGLSPSAPIGLWGYSGGGLASAWAAEISGSYAPELNIVGAVLGSPVGDLGHTFRRLNGTLLCPGCPRSSSPRSRTSTPTSTGSSRSTRPKRARPCCSGYDEHDHRGGGDAAGQQGHGRLVDQPLEQILGTPEVQQVFDGIKLGMAVPTPPVLIVQAVHDQIISVDDIDELADTYSAGGASVTYHRDMFSEHMLLHPMSAPMTLRWLTDRFAGKPLTENLVRTKWPTLLNPMTYMGMARLVRIAAKVVTGRTVERSPL